MQILKLDNSLGLGSNVTRLWLAPGLARLGAVFGDDILYNAVGLCWDTTTHRAIWESYLLDSNENYPDPNFDRELTRVVFTVPPDWDEGRSDYLCIRVLASGAEVKLKGPSTYHFTMTPDGQDVFAVAIYEPQQTRELLRWRIPAKLTAANKPKPNRKWAIALPHGRGRNQQVGNITTALTVSPDGKRIATGHCSGAVTVWEVASRRKIAKIPELKSTKSLRYSALRLAFSHDGTRLATIRDKPRDRKCDYSVSVWSIPGGKHEKGPKEKVSVNDMAFSPDGHTLLTAREDGSIGVWDTATWKLRREYAWKIGKLFSVTFSLDGLTCAAGGEKGQVVIWDMDT